MAFEVSILFLPAEWRGAGLPPHPEEFRVVARPADADATDVVLAKLGFKRAAPWVERLDGRRAVLEARIERSNA